jgi:hypothetical protein
MSRYFNFFPKTLYTPENKSLGLDTVTNIVARFGFESSLKENSSAFYKYDIREGDTPEIIAAKYYDHPERHWIVLMFNDIFDPQFDWPMQNRVLVNYINTKYSANNYADTANTGVTGISWAMNINNVHGYYKVVTRTNEDGEEFVEKIELDANTYANTSMSSATYTLDDGNQIEEVITKETQTYFDYENELNEAKRTIKLLKPEFVPSIEKEFKKVIKA